MSRSAWHSRPPAAGADTVLTPQSISKQQFGRRLYELMIKQGMNQSDLARAAKLGRDSISTYVRGISLPDPVNLQKLADALGVSREELLPNIVESAADREHPAMEIKMAHGDSGHVWVRINRQVKTETATKIFELISKDDREAQN